MSRHRPSHWYWSKPHHGVSHLICGHRMYPQFTIEQHKTFVDAYMLTKGFTPSHEETFDTVVEAKVWLEQLAVEHIGDRT